MMKLATSAQKSSFALYFLVAIFIGGSLCYCVNAHRHLSMSSQEGRGNEDKGNSPKEGEKNEVEMEMFPTGSSLPDCSHACGACVPCKRVMVSYKCSIESCPVVYRCMCKGKYYHVPSN